MNTRVILLVEDDPRDELLTLRALRKSKISNDVVVAHDGVEALAYLFGVDGRSPRPVVDLPAMVLLDLKLPKIDGLEVLRRVRADPRTVILPVIIMTSSNEDQDRLAGYRAGANSFVRKPVESRAFADAVERVGLYWLHLNEQPPPTGE